MIEKVGMTQNSKTGEITVTINERCDDTGALLKCDYPETPKKSFVDALNAVAVPALEDIVGLPTDWLAKRSFWTASVSLKKKKDEEVTKVTVQIKHELAEGTMMNIQVPGFCWESQGPRLSDAIVQVVLKANEYLAARVGGIGEDPGIYPDTPAQPVMTPELAGNLIETIANT